MVCEFKKLFGYDDTLDVFGIHGVGGIVGALLTGILATSAVNPIFTDAAGTPIAVGLLEGNPGQVVNQLVGIGIAVLLAVAGTGIVLKVVDLAIGLRVSEMQELAGLDATQHGERAYVFEGVPEEASPAEPEKAAAEGINPGRLVFDVD
jgi:Amt family ammonium transporter